MADSPLVVLFDLDGTLIDTRQLYMECYRAAVLPHLGRELSSEEIMAMRPRSELRFLRDAVGAERFEACLADFHEAYRRLHDTHFRGIYPGVPGMLATLRDRRLPLGIVTGKSRRSWELTSVRDSLGAFDVLVFDDDVTEPKPDPQGILSALASLAAPPGNAVYLGDSVSDIEAAAAAGVRPAGVLWARTPENRARFIERVTPFGAELFETPAEFAGKLRTGWGGGN